MYRSVRWRTRIEKSIGLLDIKSYVSKYSRPYVFGRTLENGLPRDVNSFLAIWKRRARDHTRVPLIKVKKETEREREREEEQRKDRENRCAYVVCDFFPLRDSTLSSEDNDCDSPYKVTNIALYG
jgi:hypothetical protein